MSEKMREAVIGYENRWEKRVVGFDREFCAGAKLGWCYLQESEGARVGGARLGTGRRRGVEQMWLRGSRVACSDAAEESLAWPDLAGIDGVHTECTGDIK
jgi:hypothetical protein